MCWANSQVLSLLGPLLYKPTNVIENLRLLINRERGLYGKILNRGLAVLTER